MARFKLVDGDIGVLTRAYNALNTGHGTYIRPCDVQTFLDAWRKVPSVFASDDAFVGVVVNGPQGELVLAETSPGGLSTVYTLLPELLSAYGLVALRTIAVTSEGDTLCENAGLHYDGLMRASILLGDRWADGSLWSLLPSDLQTSDTVAQTPLSNGHDAEG